MSGRRRSPRLTARLTTRPQRFMHRRRSPGGKYQTDHAHGSQVRTHVKRSHMTPVLYNCIEILDSIVLCSLADLLGVHQRCCFCFLYSRVVNNPIDDNPKTGIAVNGQKVDGWHAPPLTPIYNINTNKHRHHQLFCRLRYIPHTNHNTNKHQCKRQTKTLKIHQTIQLYCFNTVGLTHDYDQPESFNESATEGVTGHAGQF